LNNVRRRQAALTATALGILAHHHAAYADNRNAIQAATDAFGISVGVEKIGVYASDQVRGFSPTTAGNLRIDGLYFDQAGELNRRLTDQSTIRVGIAAQAYPFPAPTGIVDYRLRTVGPKAALSAAAGLADYAGPYFEADLRIPIVENKLGLVAGLGRKDDEFPDGSSAQNTTVALIGEWHATSAIRLRSFWTQINGKHIDAQPLLTVGGAWLPPLLPIRKFIGEKWETDTRQITNEGLLGDLDLGDGWILRGGLFRSIVSDASSYADLFRNIQPDGLADHLIIADPREATHSTSGELRITKSFAEGPRKHLIHAIIRGRQRKAEFGGSDRIDFGPANVTAPKPLLKPNFEFTSQTRDRVRQFTAGLAYELYWNGLGQLGLGIQKTSYQKTFVEPGNATAHTRSSPALFYANLELLLSRRLALFTGMTRGLEETGIAPDDAVNRGEALPAARTRQIDGGLSYSLAKNLKLIASVFDVRKPYFNLDSNNAFTALGQERHRGIEFSVTGSLTPRFNIVAGAVLMDARTTGEAVREGRIGKRPINSSPRRIRLGAEYLVPGIDGFSLDFGLDHDGRRIANTSNSLSLPSRTILRAGARYRFKVNRVNAQFRILVDNIADHFSWALTNSGGFRVDVGRRVTGYIAVDL
jgi:iron complex outermembrane receptor protein